jgi:hypothetical protein
MMVSFMNFRSFASLGDQKADDPRQLDSHGAFPDPRTWAMLLLSPAIISTSATVARPF